MTMVARVLTFVPLLPLLLLWPRSGQGSPILAPEEPRVGPGHGGFLDPSLLEQDSELDMQLLETLRDQFLRTFNLTGLGPPPPPNGAPPAEPPEYMMELYNRFANDHTAMPAANIVRSYKNEGNPTGPPPPLPPHLFTSSSLLGHFRGLGPWS